MKWFVTFVAVLVIGLGILIHHGLVIQDRNDATCRALGGVPFRSRDAGFICIKKDALL